MSSRQDRRRRRHAKSPSQARPVTRGRRPFLEGLERRIVLDAPGGAAAVSTLLSPTPQPTAGLGDDGWIEGFDHTLPSASDPKRTAKLGNLLFVSNNTWSASDDGKSKVFGTNPDDWTAIGLETPGQPFKPQLVARGAVTVTPDALQADPFGWSVGLYIIRNDTSSGNTIKGSYQLLNGAGSMSADGLAGIPGSEDAPANVSLTSSLPIGMVADGSGSGLSAAFTPTYMSMTPETSISRSVLTFQGFQSVAYKGSSFRFGLGGNMGNAATALTIDETGSLGLVNQTTGTDSVTATVGFGGDQTFAVASIHPVVFSEVKTTNDNGLTVGEAFTFSGLVNPEHVQNGVVYYVQKVIDSKTFQFSTDPDAIVPVMDASADAGGSVVTAGAPVKAGGFSLSGDARVTFSFNAGAPGSLPNPKDGWDLKISGQLQGVFTASSTIAGNFQVILGSSDGSVPGIEITQDSRGVVTIPNWAFYITGELKLGKSNGGGPVDSFVDLTVSQLAVANTFDPITHLGTLKINGGVSLAVAGWSSKFSALLGDGSTHDGLVMKQDAAGDYHVQSFWASVTVTPQVGTKPSDNVTFADKLKLHDFALTLRGSFHSDGTILQIQVTGNASLAVGDQTPDSNGKWSSGVSLVGVALTQGGVIITDQGLTFPDNTDVRLTASGTFQIGPLQLAAQNLVLRYHKGGGDGSDDYFLIGGTVTLPQLKGVSVTLGEGGDGDGLKVFTKTGHWELDGFKLVIPEIVVGPIELDDVTIGFSEKSAQDWDLLVGGTIVLLKEGSFQGTRITVKLELGEEAGNFIVQGFAVDLRGLDPGIPILDTGGFITDIGLDAENLNKSNVSIDAVLGASFGESIQVAGNSYSLIQVTAEGKYTPGDVDITGSMLLAGGLASGSAQLDANYAIGRYQIDVDLKFYQDFLDGHIRALITPGRIDALATLDLNVPDFIPIIGGYNLGEVGAALELTTERPDIDKIQSGEVTTKDKEYLRVGDPFKFTYLNTPAPSTFDTTQIYYVTSVNDAGTEFTFSTTAGGAPITDLNATGGQINPGPQIIAGWAKFLFWEVGVEYDFLANKFTLLGSDAIQQIINDTPSGVDKQTYTYNSTYTPPAPAATAVRQDQSTASSGTFQFPISPNSDSTSVYATVNGQTAVIWTSKTAKDSSVDVGGVRFSYSGDLSQPDNLILQASPVPDSSGFDPYDPLPMQPITFTLTSDVSQPPQANDPNDPTQGWHATFSSPPPQVAAVDAIT
ncbi:autotransporter outer membrane beta-barrel domain-containing protein, partial [Singulisphaera rosea]